MAKPRRTKTCKEAIAAIDKLNTSSSGGQHDTPETREALFKDAQLPGHLHMVARGGPDDDEDTAFVLLVEIEGGGLVRTPLNRTTCVSLLRWFCEALA